MWTYDSKLIGLFDRVYGVAASVRQSDDLCLGCLSLKIVGLLTYISDVHGMGLKNEKADAIR